MKIAILTNFQDLNPGYSLVSVVCDQVAALSRYGHDVTLFVSERFNTAYNAFRERVDLRPRVPAAELIDYQSAGALGPPGVELAARVKAFLLSELGGYQVAFTHDWVFTGWNLPYALALKEAACELDLRWLHWVHSVPSGARDWWQIRAYGSKHRLVSPTAANRQLLAEQFRGTLNDVRVVPHMRDLRSWYDFGEETCEFLNDFPRLMQAELVQVYPASSDRLAAKGLDKVLWLFAAFKRRCRSVCLVVANQWATTRQRREDLQKYLDLAARLGLEPGEDFAFTSEWNEPVYERGIPKRFLRELQLCSNLFIFPTREESFGLVAPEAALGGAYVVLNKSLENQAEIFQHEGFYAPFSSFDHPFDPHEGWETYLDRLAALLLARLRENEAFRTRTLIRRSLNWDAVYLNHYEPLLAECLSW